MEEFIALEKNSTKHSYYRNNSKRWYRVEKLIYESLPGYYVTSALFIQDNLNGKEASADGYYTVRRPSGFRRLRARVSER